MSDQENGEERKKKTIDKAETHTLNSTDSEESEYDSLEETERTEETEMESIMRAPTALSFEGNLKENWKRWRQKFEIYLEATDLNSKSDKRKVAALLHTAGEEAMEKFNTFGLTEEQAGKLEEVYKAFEEFCTPKANESVERHLFFTRVQANGESFASFLTELKKLSASCGFAELKESLIKDRIICGIRNSSIKNRLLREENLDLEKCATICRAAELAETQMKNIANESNIHAIKNKGGPNRTRGKPVNKQQPFKQREEAVTQMGQRSQSSRYSSQLQPQSAEYKQQRNLACTRCGKQHKPRDCPAFGKTCMSCRGKNHFAAVCKKKLVNSVDREEEVNSLYVASININKDNNAEWYETIVVNKKYKATVKLDSGAPCNLISLTDLECKVDKDFKLSKIVARLTAYGGNSIQTEGTCRLLRRFNNREETELEFVVVSGYSRNHPTIIGLPTLIKLNLIKRVHTMNMVVETDIGKDIEKEYKDIFTGLGVIKNFEYEIRLKENVKGRIASCRNVPIALLEPLKEELRKMEQCNIIERVIEPSEWVHPIVIARKKNGKIRLCLDPTYLNECILRQHHVIPSFEEICARMPSARVFSTLDADRAFW